ncbi:MAG: cytochrome d ubiquinol oxidase subunit II [Coriobacteriaceae bacterium]|nr:cytochrome d ubiquinol oxidase subunit II [Coriobacteriaceae bacterium]
MSPLAFIWFLLIGVLISGYFILDGFDLGAGVLYPVLAKSEADRAVIRRSIGPVWDGNEVWVLTAGGALFAAFGPAYATSFSGFYLAIMLVLFGLIIRAVALEFRAHDAAWGKLYDVLFVLGSFLPALLYGVAIGNVVGGVNLDAHGDFAGSFFDLLNPFALLCGVLGFVHMLVQGAGWIALKAPAGTDLARRARALRGKLAVAEIAVFALTSVVLFVAVVPGGAVEIRALAVVFAIVFLAASIGALKAPSDLLAQVLASVGCVGLVGVAASTLFPNLITATDPAYSITIAGAAGSDMTLAIMLGIACIGVPLVLVYHVIAYRIFRGRLKKEDLTY